MSFGPAHTCMASIRRVPPGSSLQHGDVSAQFHNFFPLLLIINLATWVTKRGLRQNNQMHPILQKELPYMYDMY